MDGWIKINRQITDHWLWSDAEKLKWWLDLLLLAAWEEKQVMHDSHLFTLHKGQIIASISYLSKRWGKCNHTIINFFKLLEDDGMVSRQILHRQTPIITICNYEKYQTQDESQAHTQAHSIVHTNKESKESKEKEKIDKESVAASAAALIEKRQQEFYNSLIPYVELYGKEMIRAFYDYWTEPNKSKTKMRFDLQPTWDVERRLRTWSNKESKRNMVYGTDRQPNTTPETRAEEVAGIMARLAAEDDARTGV